MKETPADVTFDEVPASHPDAIHTLTQYFGELDARFDGGFEPGNTLIVDAPAMTAPVGAFVVVHSGGTAIRLPRNRALQRKSVRPALV